MPSQNKYILDLDGTIYQYEGRATFSDSRFYRDIKRNVFSFLQTAAGIPAGRVEETYTRLKKGYGGHVSLAVEREFGIDRGRYFAATWNLDPSVYIVPSHEPRFVLEKLRGRFAVLTAAPRVWAEAALGFLNVSDLVGDALFTCDSDIRKPSPEAFAHVGTFLNVPFDRIFSVGDQEASDIIPPKSVGMRAIRVGSSETSADAHIHTLIDLLTLSIDGEPVM